jgi:LSD1 subclass zinc finger protein
MSSFYGAQQPGTPPSRRPRAAPAETACSSHTPPPPLAAAGAGAQAQLTCGGCRTLLMYPQVCHARPTRAPPARAPLTGPAAPRARPPLPAAVQGAQAVRCARCAHITPAPPPAPDMAQLTCTNPACRVALMYPRGAAQVQCSLCATLNDAAQANALGHVVCGGCQVGAGRFLFCVDSGAAAHPGAPPRFCATPPSLLQPTHPPPPPSHPSAAPRSRSCLRTARSRSSARSATT